MTMSYDPLAYEMPWRPNYEKNAVAGWLAASGAALAVEQVSTMPPEPFYWMTGICGVMAMARLPKAIKLHLLQKHLKGRDLEFISIAELQSTSRTRRTICGLVVGSCGKTAMPSACLRS